MLRKLVYAGHLLRFLSEEKPERTLSRIRTLADLEELREKKWFSFNWKPKQQIRSDHFDSSLTNDTPNYPFIFRQSSDRLILVSSHAAVVDSFLRRTRLSDISEFPRVDIRRVVDHLAYGDAGNGREYRMGVLFASLEGYGRALRTIGLWGDDIADARFFNEINSELTPYRVSIRDVRSDREVASIGSQGEVNFYYRGFAHLDQIDRLFKYLTNLNAIAWSRSDDQAK